MDNESYSNQEDTNVPKVEENPRPKFKRHAVKESWRRKKAREELNFSKPLWTSKSKEVTSSVAHFEYDFTGGFARRISNIVEEEVDTLCEQMGGMNTEKTSQEVLRERRRIAIKKKALNSIHRVTERMKHMREERKA